MEILHSNRNFAVLVKPVGLDSESDVPAALKEILGGEVFPIHRLDKNVGGVMVYARTKQSAAILSKAVQAGTMVKEYVAMVHGAPPEAGDWEDLLFKDSRKNKVFAVKRERKGVKKARLEFTRLTAGESSLVRIIPDGVTKFVCNFPPGASLWLATINMVPGTKLSPPCSSPARSPSPIREKPCLSKSFPTGHWAIIPCRIVFCRNQFCLMISK